MLPIKIKYFNENIPKIEKVVNGDWIDLRQRFSPPIGLGHSIPRHEPVEPGVEGPGRESRGSLGGRDYRQYAAGEVSAERLRGGAGATVSDGRIGTGTKLPVARGPVSLYKSVDGA
jgi:hypothetical protein